MWINYIILKVCQLFSYKLFIVVLIILTSTTSALQMKTNNFTNVSYNVKQAVIKELNTYRNQFWIEIQELVSNQYSTERQNFKVLVSRFVYIF